MAREERILAEYYPEEGLRNTLLDWFANYFLPDYARRMAFMMVRFGWSNPTNLIQGRWQFMESLMNLQRASTKKHGLITGLNAWAANVAGYPGFIVKMPTPERPSQAFYIAVVLIVPIEVFKEVPLALWYSTKLAKPKADVEALAATAKVKYRYYTLMRWPLAAPCDSMREGVIVQWPAQRGGYTEERQLCYVSRDQFISAVGNLLIEEFGPEPPRTLAPELFTNIYDPIANLTGKDVI